MKLDMDISKYCYQFDYEEGAVSIFCGLDSDGNNLVSDARIFELSAHSNVYDRIKELMKTSARMEGAEWNEEYKVWESLTFWDEHGESTTVPICGAKLGVFKILTHEELSQVLEFMEKLEKEDEESRNKPTEPVTMSFIDSNGVSCQATLVPAHDPTTPNRNKRIYSTEAICMALKYAPEVNFSNIMAESVRPNGCTGTIKIEGDLRDTVMGAMQPNFSLKGVKK